MKAFVVWCILYKSIVDMKSYIVFKYPKGFILHTDINKIVGRFILDISLLVFQKIDCSFIKFLKNLVNIVEIHQFKSTKLMA